MLISPVHVVQNTGTFSRGPAGAHHSSCPPARAFFHSTPQRRDCRAHTHQATSQHAARIQPNCPAKAILGTPAEVVSPVLLSACTSEGGRWRGHLHSRPGSDSPEIRVQGGDSTRHIALSPYFFIALPDQIDISASPINFIWVKIIFAILHVVKGHRRTSFLLLTTASQKFRSGSALMYTTARQKYFY